MPLQKLLSTLSWSKSRVECFAAMVYGVLATGRIQHNALAAGFAASKATHPSIIKRIERFFRFQAFCFLGFARVLLALLPEGPLHLVMDRTNWKLGARDINILTLAVRLADGAAVPLFWTTLPHQGSSSAEARIELLRRFQDLVGLDKIASFTADREFVGQEWLDYLVSHRIPFYIRIIDKRLVAWGQKNPKRLREFFEHLAPDEERYLFKSISQHDLTIAGKRNQKEELIVVISNDPNPKKILKIYKERWRIETLFRNTKKGGFNMEETHMTKPERIMKLMAVVSIAVALTVGAGQDCVRRQPTPFRKTVQSPLYSVFTRGLRALRELFVRRFQDAGRWLSNIISELISRSSTQRSVR